MRIVVLSLVGAAVGAIAAVIWGQAAIEYWATPPFQIPGCDYRPAIRWAMKYQLIAQGTSIVAGAIVVPLAYRLLFRGGSKEKAAS
jgi:hypothetical protein